MDNPPYISFLVVYKSTIPPKHGTDIIFDLYEVVSVVKIRQTYTNDNPSLPDKVDSFNCTEKWVVCKYE